MHSVAHRALEEGDTAGLRYMEKILSSLFGLIIRVGMCLTPEFLLWLEKPCICLSTNVLHFCFFPILEFNQISKEDTESQQKEESSWPSCPILGREKWTNRELTCT